MRGPRHFWSPDSMRPIPVVVVTDLNFPSDDFQALSLLLTMPEVMVVHIVVTDGNTWAEEVFENVTTMLSAYGRADIPVTLVASANRYRMRTRAFRAYRQGFKSFLGPYLKSWRPRVSVPHRGTGHPLAPVATTIAAHAPEVVILSLAPLHPVAELADLAPALLTGVREILVMAGNFSPSSPGSAKADFNVWFDPHAAGRLLESGLEISVVPRNACESCVVDEATLAELGGGVFQADVVGMLTQHGPDFPLIDTVLPLLLVEPGLVTRTRRGVVRVRRRPLRVSGRTHFAERRDGTITLVDELDPDRLRSSLVRRLAGTRHHPGQDFRVRSSLRQRLFDRPFHQLDLSSGEARRLDLDALTGLYEHIAELDPALVPLPPMKPYSNTVLTRQQREAALAAKLMRVDAVATDTADTAGGVAWLSVPVGWRCREFGRHVREGDAVLECASDGRPTAESRTALVRWWSAECERRRIPLGRLHC